MTSSPPSGPESSPPSDPDPARMPGLEPGGGVAPGDTPPVGDTTGAISEDRDRLPNQGPKVGNRGPMTVALVVVGVIVVLVIVMLVGMVISAVK